MGGCRGWDSGRAVACWQAPPQRHLLRITLKLPWWMLAARVQACMQRAGSAGGSPASSLPFLASSRRRHIYIIGVRFQLAGDHPFHGERLTSLLMRRWVGRMDGGGGGGGHSREVRHSLTHSSWGIRSSWGDSGTSDVSRRWLCALPAELASHLARPARRPPLQRHRGGHLPLRLPHLRRAGSPEAEPVHGWDGSRGRGLRCACGGCACGGADTRASAWLRVRS